MRPERKPRVRIGSSAITTRGRLQESATESEMVGGAIPVKLQQSAPDVRQETKRQRTEKQTFNVKKISRCSYEYLCCKFLCTYTITYICVMHDLMCVLNSAHLCCNGSLFLLSFRMIITMVLPILKTVPFQENRIYSKQNK